MGRLNTIRRSSEVGTLRTQTLGEANMPGAFSRAPLGAFIVFNLYGFQPPQPY